MTRKKTLVKKISRKTGRATILDVAKEAKVSFKTVSRVINNEPNVKPDKRALVVKAIERLAYTPSLAARGLAGNRSYLIGLLYHNASSNYVNQVQIGVLSKCRPQGFHLLIENCETNDPNVAEHIVSMVTQTRLDGVILTPPLSDNRKILDALKDRGVRIALMSPPALVPGFASVYMDEYRAAYDMTTYLVSLGHKHIGFIKGDPHHGAARRRFDGFCKSMLDHKISISPRFVQQGYFSFESGVAGANKLLREKVRPTAIFAANDDMAAGVITTAHTLGIKIPSELSVAGFDDTVSGTWPTLTTVRQPIVEMAATAVELLLAPPRGAGKNETSRLLPHKIVIRGSTQERQ